MALNAEKLELFPGYQDCISPEVKEAIDTLAAAEGAEGRGAIFTRAEVVDFILDLIGYTKDKPLH